MTKQLIRALALALVVASLAFAPTRAAVADDTCADPTTTSTASSLLFTTKVSCANSGSVEQTPSTATGESGSNTSQPAGKWVYAGYVCENGGICASYLQCADGTPMKEYYFINADGTHGETRTVCPGDPAEPDPATVVTPPTPDEIYTAFTAVAPSKAELSIQPPNGQTLVNFETIFSTAAEAFTTDKIGLGKGFTVVFEVRPTAFTWHFGDGTTLETDWPGKPWSKGADVSKLITHVYTDTKPVKASVTTTWGATVRLNGGAAVPVRGTVNVTSPDIGLEILEAQPQLVAE